MDRYHFFYDETEHSRVINYKTIAADNYYDNFTTAIVGWKSEMDDLISNKYLRFEEKYYYRKRDGELKSYAIKNKDLRFGFSSVSGNSIGFYEDLLSVFGDEIVTYFCVESKIEYIIRQIFCNYRNNIITDFDLVKYSVIKALVTYRPAEVLRAMYEEPSMFIDNLHSFLEQRIEINKQNPQLKELETEAFFRILRLLKDAKCPSEISWDYEMPFEGFKKLLRELNIQDYDLVIDKEGDGTTAEAANKAHLKDVTEMISGNCLGIRMADMFVGLISRMMHSLNHALKTDYSDGEIEKKLLSESWFIVDDRQLMLYKKLNKIICFNKPWYSSYGAIYEDDLISFISLLKFMSQFPDAESIKKQIRELPERYNSDVCDALEYRYKIIHNKNI